MYLKKLVIKNYRSFDDEGITLNFNKGINAIIGENNVGKSSVMDAIRIVYSTVTYKKDIYFNKTDFHVCDDGKSVEFAQFDVYLEDVPKVLIEIWNPVSKNASGGEFHIKFEKYIAPNGLEKVKVTHWGIGTEGNQLSSDTFEAMEVVFLGALRDSESELRPSKNSKLAQLLRNLVPEDDKRNELVEILETANNSLLEKDQIKKAKSTINSNLLKIEQELLQQEIDIGLIEPRFDSIASSLRAWVKPRWVFISKDESSFVLADKYLEKHPECKGIQGRDRGIYFDVTLLHKHTEMDAELLNRIKEIANGSFELYQNGLGYNNLLFMSAVLGDMEIDKGGIYQNLLLIEEPEAHLHPQLQELVHSFLSATKSEKTNIQVIYTSHSPTLISKVGIENINLLYENDHKKYCLPLTETNICDSDKAYLKKYLDVTKSQLFFAKGILFVEGISEAILIPELAKLINRPFDKYAVELVNVDSVAFKPFVNLLTSEKVAICFNKIAVVTDDDRCTKKSEENYIDKNLDYDEIDHSVITKLKQGEISERCSELIELCKETSISVYPAIKTLEYALCCHENNIYYLLEAIKKEYKELGPKLETKVNTLNELDDKAACIWLFIRSRDKCKSAVAQYLCEVIDKQLKDRENGVTIEKAIVIPKYIENAIYCVTEK